MLRTAPGKPVFAEDQCPVFDNKFYCKWQMPSADNGGGGGDEVAMTYNLQFRQVNHGEEAATMASWKTVSGLAEAFCLTEGI